MRSMMAKSLLVSVVASVLAKRRGRPPGPASGPSISGSQGQNDQSTASSPTSTSSETEGEAPSMTPLSGAEDFTPSGGGGGRSYVLPSFQWTGYGTTNPSRTSGRENFATKSIYRGTITLQNVRWPSRPKAQPSGAHLSERVKTPL